MNKAKLLKKVIETLNCADYSVDHNLPEVRKYIKAQIDEDPLELIDQLCDIIKDGMV